MSVIVIDQVASHLFFRSVRMGVPIIFEQISQLSQFDTSIPHPAAHASCNLPFTKRSHRTSFPVTICCKSGMLQLRSVAMGPS